MQWLAPDPCAPVPTAPVQLPGHKPLLNTHRQNQVYLAVGSDLRSSKLPSLTLPGQPSIESPISPVADSQTSYPTHQLLWLRVCQQIPLTHEVLQFLRETYLRSRGLLASRPIDPYDLQSLLRLLHIHIQCTYTQNYM